MNLSKIVLTNIKICCMCGRSVPLLSAILLWISGWNFSNGKYKYNRMHCSMFDDRFFELKKIDSKYSKPLVKIFKVWLSSSWESFLDVPNTIDMHSNNLNFVFSKRRWFFWNRKMDSFPKGRSFPFWSNYWNRFVVGVAYNHMLAIVDTLFFHPQNVGLFNLKSGQTADTNQAINWLQP